MAAIGSGAVKDYETHIYLGTSSFLICHVPFKKTDLDHNIASVPAAIPEKYIVPIEQESAGSCLTFLRDNIVFYRSKETGPHAYEELDVIADAVPAGSNKLIFTPWLYGERAPIESNTIRGGFHNMSLETTLDQMVRAVFEGVAYNTRWVLGVLENFTKKKLDPLRIVGGGAVSDVWCQIYADVLNRTVQRVKDPIRANAKGAAFVAAVGLGYIKFEDVSKYCEIDRTFTPNPANREIYDHLFCEFVEIYKKTAPIYKRLNEIKK
jgi:xylulokinase